MFSFILLLFCLVAAPIIADQDVCEPDFRQCAPVGASRRGVPVIGPDLARFYDELVYTVQGISDSGRSGDSNKPGVVGRQEIEGDSLCCESMTTVILGANLTSMQVLKPPSAASSEALELLSVG